jgi:4-hydroxy-tetrahydrodipicolinate synthase
MDLRRLSPLPSSIPQAPETPDLSLSGSICALATPLRSRDDVLDLPAFGRLIDYQIAGGTRALVVAGSTGEAAALDDAEYSELLEFAVAYVADRVPVIAGTGLQATRKTIAQTQRARAAGVGHALVVAPPYVRPTQEGMYRHFSEVAEHGGLPVILYNVPSRTACDLQPATVARLARHGNIVGIKEAVADPVRMDALLALQGTPFTVLSGDDPTGARAMLAGAAGVISVAANVAPALFSALCDAATSGDRERAGALDTRLQDLYAVLGAETNPIPVKWCLAALGIGEAYLRLPLTTLSEEHHAAAGAILNRLELGGAVPAER